MLMAPSKTKTETTLKTLPTAPEWTKENGTGNLIVSSGTYHGSKIVDVTGDVKGVDLESRLENWLCYFCHLHGDISTLLSYILVEP